ncbi:putative mediator of RNA polymerase II transcription subunit 26 [Drosophila obscura]|uniref:putative mediator of RNA polymerase II transcription subunit 26 n=1 Tax=Drosophila obscura TaxID=7282 RepID=UPI001BB12F6A|nr:putative mediator of RNA polymerase II transcription subunit 26 [Drosophila obscura]
MKRYINGRRKQNHRSIRYRYYQKFHGWFCSPTNSCSGKKYIRVMGTKQYRSSNRNSAGKEAQIVGLLIPKVGSKRQSTCSFPHPMWEKGKRAGFYMRPFPYVPQAKLTRVRGNPRHDQAHAVRRCEQQEQQHLTSIRSHLTDHIYASMNKPVDGRSSRNSLTSEEDEDLAECIDEEQEEQQIINAMNDAMNDHAKVEQQQRQYVQYLRQQMAAKKNRLHQHDQTHAVRRCKQQEQQHLTFVRSYLTDHIYASMNKPVDGRSSRNSLTSEEDEDLAECIDEEQEEQQMINAMNDAMNDHAKVEQQQRQYVQYLRQQMAAKKNRLHQHDQTHAVRRCEQQEQQHLTSVRSHLTDHIYASMNKPVDGRSSRNSLTSEEDEDLAECIDEEQEEQQIINAMNDALNDHVKVEQQQRQYVQYLRKQMAAKKNRLHQHDASDAPQEKRSNNCSNSPTACKTHICISGS